MYTCPICKAKMSNAFAAAVHGYASHIVFWDIFPLYWPGRGSKGTNVKKGEDDEEGSRRIRKTKRTMDVAN